jgi:hypothetical protein
MIDFIDTMRTPRQTSPQHLCGDTDNPGGRVCRHDIHLARSCPPAFADVVRQVQADMSPTLRVAFGSPVRPPPYQLHPSRRPLYPSAAAAAASQAHKLFEFLPFTPAYSHEFRCHLPAEVCCRRCRSELSARPTLQLTHTIIITISCRQASCTY